jgi:hypothetical protein
VALVALAVLAGACNGSTATSARKPAPSSTGPGVTIQALPVTTAQPAPTAAPSTTVTTVAAAAGTTTTTAVSGSFVGTVGPVTASDVAFSYHPGCPVGPSQLRLLHLSYWGFDNQPHVGTMIVNAVVTGDVLKVFSQLFAEHFPIHQMQPVDAYQGSDPASMDADNTSGFNCRNAVGSSPPSLSVHSYGEAIDVNTVENPYIEGGTVMPPAGRAFVDRANVRPGMAVPGGQLVLAFASVGWPWGGRWSAPDYQHFSKTGG